jgi:hypothetical protein
MPYQLLEDDGPYVNLHCLPLHVLLPHTLRNIPHVQVLMSMSVPALPKLRLHLHKPAPTTTLETPLHNDRKPSTLDMVVIALPMPEYAAVGDEVMICIRVCHPNLA